MPVTNALDFSSASAAEGALKKVKQWMVRAGQPVVATEFIDKPRRSNSITYREATLTLASGQLITLRVISSGDIYQAVLNKSVVPIKNHDDMAKAVAELASAAEKNQAAFQKSLARVKVALPPGMSTPKPKMAEALQQRAAELDGQIAERKATVADLQQQLGAMTDSTGGASRAPELGEWERDVLRALGKKGYLEDGQVSSKDARDVLVGLGYVDRYVEGMPEDQRDNVLTDKGREALTMLDSVPAPAMPAGPEPMSWLGFKLVNQAYVDQVGPMEVPSRFQIGADVFLGLGQDGDKMDIAAKVIGASFRAAKVHYTLAVPTEVVGDQQMYAVLHDVDSVSVATPEDLLDSTKQQLLVDSLEAFKEPQPEWPAMSLAAAYVDARDVVGTDPAMLDSAANADAVAVLRMALDVMETNYPINIEAGNFDQAALQKRNADAYRRAIAMLDSAPVAISDSGLAQLVAIAAVSAAETSEIADQEALAELLALGMVEAESGLYLITGKGINALDDAGYDSMGEPYATGDD